MRTNDSDLFFTCSLIELIGRMTCQKRSATVDLLGRKIVSHIYANAGILHCEPIAKTAEKFIELTKIPQGVFDNVSLCKYDVPSYWTIGKVYSRLIEDVEDGDIIDALFKVYTSPISDDISNYNSDFFYQSRDFIKEQFLNWLNLNSKKTDKKPAIRFRGFTDSWEQRKLGMDIKTLPFKHLLSEPTIDGKHPVIQQGDNPIMGYSNNEPCRDYQDVVLFGDHTLSLYRPKEPFLVATDGIRIIMTEKKNADFFLCFLERYKPLAEGYKRYFSILVERDGGKPQSFEERNKIGSFFGTLDRLITLHQRE